MTALAEVVANDDDWLEACDRSEIEDGEMLEVELGSDDFVLLIGVNGKVVAVCADCPHQDQPLAEGMLEGNLLTCPLHFWQWNVETGEKIGVAELPLPRYQVKEDGGKVFVRLSPTLS